MFARSPVLRFLKHCGRKLFARIRSPGNSGPLTSPRYATLIGGCVRAASSAQFEASDAQGHTHSLHYQHTDELSFWGWRHMLDPRSFRTGGGGGCDNVCIIDE